MQKGGSGGADGCIKFLQNFITFSKNFIEIFIKNQRFFRANVVYKILQTTSSTPHSTFIDKERSSKLIGLPLIYGIFLFDKKIIFIYIF
jgi:hypothetical protein